MTSGPSDSMAQRISEIVGLLESPPADPDARRALAERLHPAAAADVEITPLDAGGVRGEWVAAPGADPQRVVLLVHGGGFVGGSPVIVRGFAGALSAASGATLLDVGYRLAPEFPCPAAVDDVVAAYRWLLEVHGTKPEHVVLGGQSAGGGVMFAALVTLHDHRLPQPAGAFAFSPMTDLTFTSPSVVDPTIVDPLSADIAPLLRNRNAYVADMSAASPLASPLFADLRGLPPVHMETSATERLVDDSRRMAQALSAAHVPVTLHETPGAIHNFPNLALDTPEGQVALERVARAVRDWTGASMDLEGAGT